MPVDDLQTIFRLLKIIHGRETPSNNEHVLIFHKYNITFALSFEILSTLFKSYMYIYILYNLIL